MTSVVPTWANAAVLLLSAAATLSAFAWALQGGGGWLHALALIGLGVAASWIAETRRSPARRLRWDGATWRLGTDRPDDDGVEGEASVAIDLGDRLLLRFVPHGRRKTAWLPLDRATSEGDWHGLRCALHARRSTKTVVAPGAVDA